MDSYISDVKIIVVYGSTIVEALDELCVRVLDSTKVGYTVNGAPLYLGLFTRRGTTEHLFAQQLLKFSFP